MLEGELPWLSARVVDVGRRLALIKVLLYHLFFSILSYGH